MTNDRLRSAVGAFAPANDPSRMLAAGRQESLRNAPRALARSAAGATDRQNAETVDTLAAAEAAGGDFEAAESTMGEPIDRARDLGRLDLIPPFDECRALHRNRAPHSRALPQPPGAPS